METNETWKLPGRNKAEGNKAHYVAEKIYLIRAQTGYWPSTSYLASRFNGIRGNQNWERYARSTTGWWNMYRKLAIEGGILTEECLNAELTMSKGHPVIRRRQ